MNREDWQAGDLALCVSEGPDPADWRTGGPALGSVTAVDAVDLDPDGVFLCFDEWPDCSFYNLGFRKIRPHLPDAEDAETIALLNGAPAKVLTRPEQSRRMVKAREQAMREERRFERKN